MTAATANALEAREGQQVIVVVVMPHGADRPSSSEPKSAQIYRLPSSLAERLSDSSRALRAAFARGVATSPLPVEILARLVRALEQPSAGTPCEPIHHRPAPAPSVQLPNLTPREREVLQLVLEGLQNKIIANTLRISMRTVENHRAAIMRKTGSKSLPALVRLAIAAGADDGLVPAALPIDAVAPRVRRGPSDRQNFITV
jgi:DNA-binding NarL/FixJ family response regulator